MIHVVTDDSKQCTRRGQYMKECLLQTGLLQVWRIHYKWAGQPPHSCTLDTNILPTGDKFSLGVVKKQDYIDNFCFKQTVRLPDLVKRYEWVTTDTQTLQGVAWLIILKKGHWWTVRSYILSTIFNYAVNLHEIRISATTHLTITSINVRRIGYQDSDLWPPYQKFIKLSAVKLKKLCGWRHGLK